MSNQTLAELCLQASKDTLEKEDTFAVLGIRCSNLKTPKHSRGKKLCKQFRSKLSVLGLEISFPRILYRKPGAVCSHSPKGQAARKAYDSTACPNVIHTSITLHSKPSSSLAASIPSACTHVYGNTHKHMITCMCTNMLIYIHPHTSIHM